MIKTTCTLDVLSVWFSGTAQIDRSIPAKSLSDSSTLYRQDARVMAGQETARGRRLQCG
ncbi:MAG: hypothetical protein R6T99_00855 [Bacteroidales bacterium]